VDLAGELMVGGLSGAEVVVIGAGEMGAGVLEVLARGNGRGRPAVVTVVNRTTARGTSAAAAAEAAGGGEVPVRAVGLDRLGEALTRAHLVVAAVEGDGHVLGPAHLAGRADPGAPLAVVDLGVPRNVDPSVATLPGVTLRNMDDLRTSVEEAMDSRRDEMEGALAIVTEEVARYRAASRARVAAPVVAALRQRLEEIRTAELARRRSADLSDAEWSKIDEVSRAALAKLLHEPTVLLKETAGTPRGERLVEALRMLFDL
jgi:glutamyl-tRNA reductase